MSLGSLKLSHTRGDGSSLAHQQQAHGKGKGWCEDCNASNCGQRESKFCNCMGHLILRAGVVPVLASVRMNTRAVASHATSRKKNGMKRVLFTVCSKSRRHGRDGKYIGITNLAKRKTQRVSESQTNEARILMESKRISKSSEANSESPLLLSALYGTYWSVSM